MRSTVVLHLGFNTQSPGNPSALDAFNQGAVTVVATERVQGQLREMDESSWDALTQLLAGCAIDTGIADLARQHDYYLYGIPKTVRGGRPYEHKAPRNVVRSSPKGL